MDELFKKAVIQSVIVDPRTISDKIDALIMYGNQVLSVDEQKGFDDISAQARITLMLEKAELIGIIEAEFIVFLLVMAVNKGNRGKG